MAWPSKALVLVCQQIYWLLYQICNQLLSNNAVGFLSDGLLGDFDRADWKWL